MSVIGQQRPSSYKSPDDWQKPRSNGTKLTEAEIGKIRAAYIAGRTIKDIARELQCSSRTVTKYYGFFRAQGTQKGVDKPARQMPSRFYTSTFEPR